MQRFQFTQDTPHGTVEIELTKESQHYNAVALLPTGSELEMHIETSVFEDALKFVEDSVDFWAEESEDVEPVDLSDPQDLPY